MAVTVREETAPLQFSHLYRSRTLDLPLSSFTFSNLSHFHRSLSTFRRSFSYCNDLTDFVSLRLKILSSI